MILHIDTEPLRRICYGLGAVTYALVIARAFEVVWPLDPLLASVLMLLCLRQAIDYAVAALDG